MKKSSTFFLKVVILLIAIGVLAGLIWFPQTEGRAAHLDLISIYTDPFIIYIYIASTPFFVGLYHAFKLLNFIDANKAFSQVAVNTLKNMKFASLSLIGFIALAEIYIRFFAHGDDPAGPTMLGICMALAFGVIATTTSVFQKLFQNAVDIKSENDLTV
ncbi:DUF2975 domain-containing protein [Dictyobacter formicarum]|uniref:Membrane protein YoaS n=1 Tax=Dictyobacter formicarum TaxID=2778368 RepID=A0ABQ3VVE2_9CHLR|nr:DUF2975 domain-containing protein [Dictyobacter formicarum]GHO89788.1 putative membrane protein YoaS [Dictyobacter formicarum]